MVGRCCLHRWRDVLFVYCARGRRTLVGGPRSVDQVCRSTVAPARSSVSFVARVLRNPGAVAVFSHVFSCRTLVGGFGVSVNGPSNDGPPVVSET